MSIVKLNLRELLENSNIESENSEYVLYSELSGGKGKKRPIKPKRFNDDSDDGGGGGFFSKLFGIGKGKNQNLVLQQDVEQLKETVANLEEKILMLSNQLDNLSRKYKYV
jgi:hypothetical protein